MARVAAVLLVVGLLAACGDDSTSGPVTGCTLYPDSCGPGDQCFPGTPEAEPTICLGAAPLAVGETCNADSSDSSLWCGRELICVGYGVGGVQKRCSPLCETDDDCRSLGIREPCKPGPRTGLRFCAVR